MSARPHTLVMSGAYCTGDVHAEYGAVPSAFLPVGMMPMYELQVQAFRRASERYCITIPDDFPLSDHESKTLRQANVEVYRADSSLSVPRALKAALEETGLAGPVRVVFGDTLVEDLAEAPDTVAVSRSIDCHDWTGAVIGDGGRATFREAIGDDDLRKSVVTGHFVFSSANRLARAIRDDSSLADLLNAYSQDKPLSLVEPARWFDVGHMSRLTKSRQDFLVARAFNSITISGQILTKRSRDEFKLRAELEWYRNLPEVLRPFVPQVISDSVGYCSRENHPYFYCLEYLHLPTLAELAVFGRLPVYRWRQLLDRCLDFLRSARAEFESANSSVDAIDPQAIFIALFRSKTANRIERFLAERAWSRNQTFCLDGRLVPALHELASRLLAMIEPTRHEHLTFAHGDFFFSNILYDSRADGIKALDPRGYAIDELPSIMGDWRYDLAKLGHSVYGHYDQIIAGRRYFTRDDDFSFRTERITADPMLASYERFEIFSQSVLTREIKAIIGLLFLSMLPLHADDRERQNQFLANAFRIYLECEEASC